MTALAPTGIVAGESNPSFDIACVQIGNTSLQRLTSVHVGLKSYWNRQSLSQLQTVAFSSLHVDSPPAYEVQVQLGD
jgi:hypothetical protein